MLGSGHSGEKKLRAFYETLAVYNQNPTGGIKLDKILTNIH